MYSQNNEEKVVLGFFKDFKGTFLDLGSNDGITLSNTRALALKGWRGVCVEAAPQAFQSLQELYLENDKVYCVNVALSNYNGKADFHASGTHLKKGDTSLLSSLDKKETQKWRSSTTFDLIKVNVVDFKTLLNPVPYRKFDFISCDIEGIDVIALKQMNLTKLGCKCLCIEWNSNQKVLDEIISYCSEFGLTKVLLKNAENIILAKP